MNEGDSYSYQIQPNSEYHLNYHSRQTVGENVHASRGKEPRPPSKVPKLLLSVFKEVKSLKQLGGWLRSSHPLKKA